MSSVIKVYHLGSSQRKSACHRERSRGEKVVELSRNWNRSETEADGLLTHEHSRVCQLSKQTHNVCHTNTTSPK